MRKVLVLTGLLVAGCATVSQMAATGGSRADGIVKLSYEVGMFDKVAIDEATALQTARRRCATWGYQDAEAFGGITRQCNQTNAYGCMRWFVTKEYQCLSTAGSQAGMIPAAPMASAASSSTISRSPGDVPGTIDLGGGVKLVPAQTPSGYCIKAPSGYVGSGSVNRPNVTGAKPRCN